MKILSPVSIKRITDSTTELLDVYEAKAHLNIIDDSDDDDLIADYIVSARHAIEEHQNRALASSQDWQAGYKCFSWTRFLEIPRPPLVSVDSVKYYDTNNTEQTVSASNYVVDDSADGPACLKLTDNFSFPALSDDYQAPVKVNFTAGYTASNFPKTIKQGILKLVSDLYETRGSHVIGTSIAEMPTFKYLINQKKVWNSF